ncbi:MAG: pitrilysin family protein, partial [Candidatus Eisenbacteria bacterium]|nr:pitrilysin family protein [Candidatus Eisenbacteria bacterium]
ASDVYKRQLPNGAQLLVLSSPESPVLALHLFLKGRSAAEPAGMDGMAELLQRLLPAGSGGESPAPFSDRLRAIGAELKTADDPSIPYDDYYSTPLYAFVRLQTLDRFAPEAFSILADMIRSRDIRPDTFEEARGAMRSQAERSASSAGATARQLLRDALYGGTPRSRALFGTVASLERITPEALRSYADQALVGSRLLLVVATSLPPETIGDLFAKRFGSIPAGGSAPPLPGRSGIAASIRARLAQSDPLPSDLKGISVPESTYVQVRRIGARQGAVTWAVPLGQVSAERFPAVEVWNAVLSARIQFQLREKEGLAYSIGSSVERADDGTVIWIASAGTGASNIPRIVEGFREQLEASLAASPDSAAIRTQGAQAYGRSLMRRATRMNRAAAAGQAILEGRDPAGIDEEIRAPARVRPEEVAAVV